MRQQRTICVALFVVTVALYAPVINHDFVNYDDDLYIANERMVNQGLSWAGVRWAFTGSHVSNWHPVTWISHMLDCTLFGQDPAGHHLTSVLFHAANAALLFLVLGQMTGTIWRSALVAALFAWHPLHVESVAWVAERKDVLSTFFGLLAVQAYVPYTRRRNWTPYALSLFWYALSLMSKPMLVTLPFLLLLIDYWPLARLPAPFRNLSPSSPRPATEGGAVANATWARLLAEKAPFFVLAIASSIVTVWAQNEGKSLATLQAVPFQNRLMNSVTAYAMYLGKTFWPTDLAVLYPLPLEWHWSQVARHSLVLAGLCGLVLHQLRRRPFLAVGWFWFVGTLIPVIGLVQVGSQAMADRYTYVPLIGVFIMMAWALGELAVARPGWTNSLTLGVGGLLVGCVLLSRLQLHHWRDSVTLFEHAIAVTQRNYVAHGNLGAELLEIGEIDRSIRCLQEAMRLMPYHVPSHINLGLAMATAGQTGEAQSLFAKALQLAPDNVQANYFMGVSLASNGRYAEAKPLLLKAIALAPGELYYRHGVALIMAKQNDEAAAIEQFTEILRRNRNDDSALYNLGAIFARQGRIGDAIGMLKLAVRLNPDSVEPLRSLAWILATAETASHRNGLAAVECAERALSLSKDADAYLLDTLAAAYAEAGRFTDAAATARQALELAGQRNQPKLAVELQNRLRGYESQKPYREGRNPP